MTTPAFFLKHIRTEYTGDQVTIYVARSATMPDGSVLPGTPEALVTTQTALGALAVANGASADRWGDQEVTQTLNAAVIVDKEEVPAVPEVPAVIAADGVTVETPAVPAVAAIPAVTHLQFAGLPVVF